MSNDNETNKGKPTGKKTAKKKGPTVKDLADKIADPNFRRVVERIDRAPDSKIVEGTLCTPY